MSLARLALRLSTARALRDATLAGSRVFDSSIDPVDLRLSAERQPVITVYTDDHEETTRGRGEGIGGDASCDLVIEFAVAGLVSAPVDGGAALVIAETDEAMEFLLDLMERQIVSALTAGQGPWATLWRVFCVGVNRRMSRRGASAEDASRFAARQLTLTCDLLIDPAPSGAVPPGAWADLVATMEADAALSALAPLMRSEIEGTSGADWHSIAAALGVNLDVASALGIGPYGGGAEANVPLMEADVDA